MQETVNLLATVWHPGVSTALIVLTNRAPLPMSARYSTDHGPLPHTLIFAFFGKMTAYDKICKILFRKFTSQHRSTLLCAKFVKIVRWNIGEIVRYLLDQKKFRFPLKLSLMRESGPKSAMVSPNIWLTKFQTSSKSVHFRRSYRRPREGRSLGPLGKSNTRPKRCIASGE